MAKKADDKQMLGRVGESNVDNEVKKKVAKKAVKTVTAAAAKKLETQVKQLQLKIEEMQKEQEEQDGDIEVAFDCFSVFGRLIHVKVGSADKPALEDEIAKIENGLGAMFNNSGLPCFVFVTHHDVHIDVH